MHLLRQYSVADGERRRPRSRVPGHSSATATSPAWVSTLDQLNETMLFIQGRNEEGTGARRGRLRQELPAYALLRPATASIGPGVMNLVTGAALAILQQAAGFLRPRRRRRGPGMTMQYRWST